MEERGAVGNKDKKFVLYTVVGDERGKATAGIWAVRIILGVLLIIALAIVPYISLRMAQVSNRTLVVFQPVLVTNHSKSDHTTPRESLSAMRSVHNSNILQSASLKKENMSMTQPSERITATSPSNGTLFSLHETAVTFSLLDGADNETKGVGLNFTREKVKAVLSEDLNTSTSSYVSVFKNTNDNLESPTSSTTDSEDKSLSPLLFTINNATKNKLSNTTASSSVALFTTATTEIIKDGVASFSTEVNPIIAGLLKSTVKPLPKLSKPLSSQESSQPAVNNVMTHKLAYVAAASSGNHVGGICIWKTNRNITHWSYFFDNIPMEYQSHKDSTDHDLKALLVAVRMWANKWSDYHVVLRSQSNAIEGSTHRTRSAVISELEAQANNKFTYELEWRLRKDDSLMGIAYSLARLYKDFNYWSNEFEERLERVIGKREGIISQMRVPIPQETFATIRVESQIQKGGLEHLKNSGN